MMSEWLGVAHDQVRVFQGDTDKILYGRGTFSQRSMIAGGSALKMAADEVIKKGKRLAGYMLEASASDIEFKDSKFRITGTDRAVSFAEVAKKSYMGAGLPAEFGVGLDGVGAHPGPNTFPNGCMICEVEVDPDTGNVKVLTLFAVDDSGVVINPLTLEGQLHGSTAQGLGEALFEQVVYDRQSGQLLSGSFMDYAMPRAERHAFHCCRRSSCSGQNQSARSERWQRSRQWRRAARHHSRHHRCAFGMGCPGPSPPRHAGTHLAGHPSRCGRGKTGSNCSTLGAIRRVPKYFAAVPD